MFIPVFDVLSQILINWQPFVMGFEKKMLGIEIREYKPNHLHQISYFDLLM